MDLFAYTWETMKPFTDRRHLQPQDAPSLIVGDNTYLGPGLFVSIAKEISIGASYLLGSNVRIADNDGHPIDPVRRAKGDSIDLEDPNPPFSFRLLCL